MRIPTYESHQQISSVNASTGGAGYGIDGFVDHAGMQRARGLGKLADGIDKLNAAVTAYAIDKRQEQLDLDLLADMQALRADSATFMDDYAAKNKGANARGAALAGQAFFDERLTGLREKYAESPQGLKYIEAHGGGLALQGISALSDYSRREGEAYKDSVYEGELEQARLRLLDHNTPDSERAAIYEDLRRKTVGFYGGRGRDATAAMAKLEGFQQKVEAEAWQNRLAYMRETNPEEAVRLAKAAVQGNVSARFESGTDGIYSVGYDSNGGTSYGKYQIASRKSMGAFLSHLDNAAPDLAKRLRAAGPANTGGRSGAMPEEWKKIAAEDPARFEQLQEEFIDQTHVQPALKSLPAEAQSAVANDPRLAEALRSTAVQHGPEGCRRLFGKAWESSGGDAAKLIQDLYEARKGDFPSSTEKVRQSVAARMDEEKALLLSGGGSGGAPGAASDLSRALSPQQLSAELHKAESEISRRQSEQAATEADNMALDFMERVKSGEDYDAVHKDILALAPKLRGPVNTLFQSHHRDWHNANVLKSNDAIVDNRNAMGGMTLGQAYKFVGALPESSPLERTVKKQALADYALAAQHGGMHKTTDPNVYSQLVEAIHYGEIRDEKALRAHPQAVAVAENDLKKLLTDIKGAGTITEKSLQTAYRWSIGKSEDDPKAGTLSDSEKRDFMRFSDWARATAAKSAKAGDPEYARTLARMWRMEGETRSRNIFHRGYGKDQHFGEGMDDPSWLPELGNHRPLVVQAFRENPALAAKWAERYDGNMEWGMRGYLKKTLLQQNLEPMKRPAAANEPTQAENE